jgi:non-specific protein-tyrosine kinase
VLDETIQRLGLVVTPEQLNDNISVSPVPDTQLLSITVTDPDPERSALIANMLAQVFIDQTSEQEATRAGTSRQELQQSIDSTKRRIDETSTRIADLQGRPNATDPTVQSELGSLRAQLTQYQTTYSSLLETQQRMDIAIVQSSTQIRIVDEANPPGDVFRPRVALNTGLAAMLGLILAAGLVLLLSYLDDSVKTSDDLVRLTGSAALGSIPRLAEGGVELTAAPSSMASEAYRSLRTNLQFAALGHPVRTLLITSIRPEEGKTTTVVGLGAVFAHAGQEVILVDADLRKPQLHKRFPGLTNRHGLTNLLLSDPNVTWDSLLQETSIPRLRVLTTGPIPPNPADILTAPRLVELLDELAARADLVLVDTPPLAVSDAVILSGVVGGVLLLVESGKARSKELVHAVQELTRNGKPLLGIILNRVKVSERSYSYYRSYHSSDSDDSGIADAEQQANGRAAAKRRGLPRSRATVKTREGS